MNKINDANCIYNNEDLDKLTIGYACHNITTFSMSWCDLKLFIGEGGWGSFRL